MHIGRQEHALLLAAGFQHEFYPEYYRDYGDPESGPMIDGEPEHDVYVLSCGSEDYTIVSESGNVVLTQCEHGPPGFDVPF